ncbi:MAG: multidrug efflux pump subunit AcrB [Myxococcota bacterium]|jgi:multidrug efflux pump subunit AcrB
MERLIRFFVERHVVVNVLTVAVVAIGLMTMFTSKIEGFPAIDLPTFMISAQLPGASARDVEAKLTIPLEEAISEVDGVLHYTTIITQNRSMTTVDLHPDTQTEEILEADRALRAAIDGVPDFPAEMRNKPQTFRMDPSKQPIFEVALAGPAELLPDMAKRIERKMRSIDGVAEVGIVGLPDPELSVFLDPDLARTHGITLLDVVQALEKRNISATGGSLETSHDRRQVVLWGRFETPDEVGNVILRSEQNDGMLRVRDVARVVLGREDTGLIVGTNGRAGISVIPSKLKDADLIQTRDRILKALAAIEISPGVEYTIVNDSSYEIRNRLSIIGTNGAMGLALVALIVFLFLAPSAATWVCMGVPLVILGVVMVLPAFDMTINFMSTIAFVVVLGLLVDDAVVVAEKVLLKRQEGLSPVEAAIQGASEVASPVIASALTTLVAFAPIMAIGGFAQRIMWQLPAVVCIALALSLIESFLILPAHMSMVRSDSKPRPKRRFMLDLEERYRRALHKAMPRRGRIIAGFASVWLFVMLVIAPQMQFEFFPQDSAAGLFLKVRTPVGTPIERTEAVLDALQIQLPPIMGDDLEGITARVGHQNVFDLGLEYGSSENEGLISVYLDLDEREHSAAAWIEVIRERLRIPEDASVVFEPKIDGPPGLEPISVYVLSNDDTTRREVAAEIQAFVRRNGGVDVSIDERPGMRQIDLNLDYEKLAMRGLDTAAVGNTLQAAFYGLIATEIRDLDDTIDVRVLFEPAARQSIDALLETQVRNSRDELVLLRDVVSPAEMPALAAIRHRDGIRAANVTGALGADSDLTGTSMAELMEKELFPRYADRDDVELEISGEVVQTREATGGLGMVFLLSVLGIACIIAIMLGSFLEAFFVVAVVPFSIAGVTLTFYLHGMHFSMLAMMGTVGLAGVVVNASIVMIDAVHREQKKVDDGDEFARLGAVIDALVGRLRPILVTTLSTLGGVLPTAYGLGGYDAVMSPMSLALGWGLAISTTVTLFLVPALYITANDWTRRIDAWRKGRDPTAGSQATA